MQTNLLHMLFSVFSVSQYGVLQKELQELFEAVIPETCKPFRMPLQSEDREVTVDNGFRQKILTVLEGYQIRSELADALVMRAVYRRCFLKKRAECRKHDVIVAEDTALRWKMGRKKERME